MSSVEEAWQGGLVWVGKKNQHHHVQHRKALGTKDHTLLQQGSVRADPASGQRALLDTSPVTVFLQVVVLIPDSGNSHFYEVARKVICFKIFAFHLISSLIYM